VKHSITGDTEALDEQAVENIVEAPNSDDELVEAASSESGSDDEGHGLKYEAMVEQYLDSAYQSYLQKQQARDSNRKEKERRRRLVDSGALFDINTVHLRIIFISSTINN
jgi:hypothetical protein